MWTWSHSVLPGRSYLDIVKCWLPKYCQVFKKSRWPGLGLLCSSRYPSSPCPWLEHLYRRLSKLSYHPTILGSPPFRRYPRVTWVPSTFTSKIFEYHSPDIWFCRDRVLSSESLYSHRLPSFMISQPWYRDTGTLPILSRLSRHESHHALVRRIACALLVWDLEFNLTLGLRDIVSQKILYWCHVS